MTTAAPSGGTEHSVHPFDRRGHDKCCIHVFFKPVGHREPSKQHGADQVPLNTVDPVLIVSCFDVPCKNIGGKTGIGHNDGETSGASKRDGGVEGVAHVVKDNGVHFDKGEGVGGDVFAGAEFGEDLNSSAGNVSKESRSKKAEGDRMNNGSRKRSSIDSFAGNISPRNHLVGQLNVPIGHDHPSSQVQQPFDDGQANALNTVNNDVQQENCYIVSSEVKRKAL